MDADGAADESAYSCGRRSRVVLTPRRWRQVGERNFTGDGGKQARSPGRARSKLLKPSRAGMPGDPGATVVTNACAYYTSRTRLRMQRAPGIPRALCWADRSGTTRAQCVAGRRRCILRHCEEPTGRANARPMTGSATKQSILSSRLDGLLRCARNDGLPSPAHAYAHTPGTIDLRGRLPLLGPRHRETTARSKAPAAIAG